MKQKLELIQVEKLYEDMMEDLDNLALIKLSVGNTT